jgi:uncharacterized protein
MWHSLAVSQHGMDGFSPDKQEAMKLYRQAALGGHPNAANNLGVGYTKGDGVAKDLTQAAKWFQLAANAGHPPALNNYAQALVNGLVTVSWRLTEYKPWYVHGPRIFWLQGVEKDWDLAMTLFKMAAAAGERAAMHNLGMAYHYGKGSKLIDVRRSTLHTRLRTVRALKRDTRMFCSACGR